jgi:hypothetical protein
VRLVQTSLRDESWAGEIQGLKPLATGGDRSAMGYWRASLGDGLLAGIAPRWATGGDRSAMGYRRGLLGEGLQGR